MDWFGEANFADKENIYVIKIPFQGEDYMKKKKITILLTVLFLLIGSIFARGIAKGKSTDKCMDTIKEIISTIDNRDWDEYLSHLEESNKTWMQDHYFAEAAENTLGINQITGAKLKNTWLLDYEDLKRYITYNGEDVYEVYEKAGDENIFGYLLEVDYNVSTDSSYFHQGTNYNLWVFILDEDEYKLAQFSTPDDELTEKYVNGDNA